MASALIIPGVQVKTVFEPSGVLPSVTGILGIIGVTDRGPLGTDRGGQYGRTPGRVRPRHPLQHAGSKDRLRQRRVGDGGGTHAARPRATRLARSRQRQRRQGGDADRARGGRLGKSHQRAGDASADVRPHRGEVHRPRPVPRRTAGGAAFQQPGSRRGKPELSVRPHQFRIALGGGGRSACSPPVCRWRKTRQR